MDLQASPGWRGVCLPHSLPTRRGRRGSLEGPGGKRDGRGADSSGFSDTRRCSRPSWGTRVLHATGTRERTVRILGAQGAGPGPTPGSPWAERPHPSTPPLSEFRKRVNSGGWERGEYSGVQQDVSDAERGAFGDSPRGRWTASRAGGTGCPADLGGAGSACRGQGPIWSKCWC